MHGVPAKPFDRPWRWLAVPAAAVCWLVGMAGTLAPGLPTTPLMLLAGWLLGRSSPRWYARLMSSRVAGTILREWAERPGVRPHVKPRAALVTLAATIAAQWLLNPDLPGTVALLSAGMAGILVILGLPTIGAPTSYAAEVRRPLLERTRAIDQLAARTARAHLSAKR